MNKVFGHPGSISPDDLMLVFYVNMTLCHLKNKYLVSKSIPAFS